MKSYRAIGGKQRRVNGWSRPTAPSPHAALAVAPPTASIVSIPNELRPKVQDQGNVGDCTCQALRELMTGLALRDGLGEILYSCLAPYYWARVGAGIAPSNDSGSHVSTVMTVAQQHGVPLIDLWNDSQPFDAQPDPVADADAAKHKALLVFSLPNVATIKSSIADGFAVELGFECPSSLFADKTLESGDIELPDDPKQFSGDGHAVSLVEADDNYSIGAHKGAFLINCHWGTDVGLKGYFHLPYDYLIMGRAHDAHTIRMMAEGA